MVLKNAYSRRYYAPDLNGLDTDFVSPTPIVHDLERPSLDQSSQFLPIGPSAIGLQSSVEADVGADPLLEEPGLLTSSASVAVISGLHSSSTGISLHMALDSHQSTPQTPIASASDAMLVTAVPNVKASFSTGLVSTPGYVTSTTSQLELMMQQLQAQYQYQQQQQLGMAQFPQQASSNSSTTDNEDDDNDDDDDDNDNDDVAEEEGYSTQSSTSVASCLLGPTVGFLTGTVNVSLQNRPRTKSRRITRKCKLSQEEIKRILEERLQRRKANNKRTAHVSRERRKNLLSTLPSETEHIKSSHELLQKEESQLAQENARLRDLLIALNAMSH